MHHHWCQQHLRNYHNGFAIIITIQMLLLTPVMMHPWMKFMLLMLMMSMLMIMIRMILLMMIMIITMISMFPDRTQTRPRPDPDRTRAGPVRTRPDRARPVQNTLYSVKIQSRPLSTILDRSQGPINCYSIVYKQNTVQHPKNLKKPIFQTFFILIPGVPGAHKRSKNIKKQ